MHPELFYSTTSMTGKSLFLTNVFPDGNKGGAAITGATIAAAIQAVPDSTVTLIATQVRSSDFAQSHRYTMRAHPKARVVMPIVAPRNELIAGLRATVRSLPLVFSRRARDRHTIAKEIAQADLVVSKGGYVFVERHTLRNLLSNWLTVLPLIIAARAGVPTAAIGATVGPFTTWFSKSLNGWVLRQLDLVVPRDEYSYRAAIEAGVSPAKLAMLPDVVFSHPGPDPHTRELIAERFAMRDRRVGVVTIAEGPGDAEFLPGLRDCLIRLVEQNVIDIVMLVFQSDQDAEITMRFAEMLPQHVVEFRSDDLSPDELIALYAEASFVLARRMHSAIFALIAGVPTFAVAKYAVKVQGVMRSLNLEDYLVDYPQIDVDQLCSRIKAAVADRDAVSARVSAAVEKARDELLRLPLLLRKVANRQAISSNDLVIPAPADSRRIETSGRIVAR
jgi:colanic acid/amylovoran biosynthesis protein